MPIRGIKSLSTLVVATAAISGTALVGTIGTATAAPLSSRVSMSTSAVVNLGLSVHQAQCEQRWLRGYGYTGALDGQLGPNSWKAYQTYLKRYYGYTAAIDGIVGPGTVSALQRMLRAENYYSGPIDGIAGPGTQAGFRSDANMLCSAYGM